jgi:hypothetical protein
VTDVQGKYKMSVSDKKIDQFEEIFSRVTIPELSKAFAISKEEDFEGVWHFRIYNFAEDLHKPIEEREFLNIRDIMQKAVFAYNANSDLAARTHFQKLINIWKEHWDVSGRN